MAVAGHAEAGGWQCCCYGCSCSWRWFCWVAYWALAWVEQFVLSSFLYVNELAFFGGDKFPSVQPRILKLPLFFCIQLSDEVVCETPSVYCISSMHFELCNLFLWFEVEISDGNIVWCVTFACTSLWSGNIAKCQLEQMLEIVAKMDLYIAIVLLFTSF